MVCELLPLPWYADYHHACFGLCLLAATVLALWLLLTFGIIASLRARPSTREARGLGAVGFSSRLEPLAPTLLCVVMLTHAYVHAGCFDENVDDTAVTFLSASDQGLTRFLPADVVTVLLTTHRGVEAQSLSSSAAAQAHSADQQCQKTHPPAAIDYSTTHTRAT